MIISGCLPQNTFNPTETNLPPVHKTNTTTVFDSTSIAPTKAQSPTATQTFLPSTDGPLLLIQTGFTEYQILTLNQQTSYSFHPPGEARHYNLAANLSPSKQQMIFPVSDETVMIVNLRTSQVLKTVDLFSSTPTFDPNQAATEAIVNFPEQKYSHEAMVSAVKQAFQTSMMIYRWYQSDRYTLSVQNLDSTSTNLHLNDLQTGMQQPLERLPGIVENFWVSPHGDKLLLKKGFVFDPGAWQDDAYYLVDVNTQTTQQIQLPDDVDNPAVFWLSSDSIGIIHQPHLVGGIHYSIINITTMESTQLVEGAFTHLRHSREGYLLIRQDQQTKTTVLTLLNREGVGGKTQVIDDPCLFSSSLGGDMILNCPDESVLVDENLQISSFGDPVRILSTAPISEKSVLVTRTDKVFLINPHVQERQSLSLESPPLEIRWLPDSSGFLYRTQGKLYLYELANGQSRFLLTSDLFSDYANLNAVWIRLE